VKKETILRAWRDPEFRESLSAEERAALPAHPSAAIELLDEQLTAIQAGLSAVGDISDTVKTSNTPGTYAGCCICCVVAGDPATSLFG
jgi:mersacidin/lichenicidin family type 2 lantibiotic